MRHSKVFNGILETLVCDTKAYRGCNIGSKHFLVFLIISTLDMYTNAEERYVTKSERK